MGCYRLKLQTLIVVIHLKSCSSTFQGKRRVGGGGGWGYGMDYFIDTFPFLINIMCKRKKKSKIYILRSDAIEILT